jgi:hypothetical protein
MELEATGKRLFIWYSKQNAQQGWYQMPDLGTKDDYQFFLDAGPLSNLDKYYYGKDNELAAA